MKKILTSTISIITLLNLQLFITVAAFAKENKSHLGQYVNLAQKNIDAVIVDFNKIQKRNAEGILAHYGNNEKISISNMETLSQITKTKSGFKWLIEKGLTITFTNKDLILGRVFVNNKMMVLPQTKSLNEFVTEFQKSFDALQLTQKTGYSLIPSLFIADVEAATLFALVGLVALGFFFVMIGAHVAYAATPEAKCLEQNDCNCLIDLGISPTNIDTIITHLKDNINDFAKFQSINPSNESCAQELSEVWSAAKDSKKIDFGGSNVSDISKNICKQAKFAKECEEKKSGATKESAPKGHKSIEQNKSSGQAAESSSGTSR